MATSCGYEFQVKLFGFADASPDLFYRLQWTRNKWVFLAYRFFMIAYCLAWLVAGYAIFPQENFWHFLSNWSEVVMNIYFLWAFLIAIYAVATYKPVMVEDSIRWFHVINWVLFNVSTVAAFIVSILYWALLAPSRTTERNLQPITFHVHATNSILMLIEIFMVAFPVRLLHVIYVLMYGIVYTVFLLVLHFTGTESSVYDVIDFANSAGPAAGYLLAAVIIAPMLLHSIVFGFYHLRALIARRTVLKESQPLSSASATSSNKLKTGKVNPAFSDPTSNQLALGTLA